MHNRIVRQQLNRRRHGCHQRVISRLIATESRRQHQFPSYADVSAFRKNHSVPAIHHGEIVSDIYLLHTFDRTKINLGSRRPARKRERPFSPYRLCTSVSAR